MKIIITESKLNNTILNYLDKNWYPDYGWSDKSYYSEEINKYGNIDFLVNDNLSYTFSKWEGNSELYIRGNAIGPLTDLFGNFWVPVFKEWFEKNTGLQVDSMVDGYFNLLI